MPVCYAVYEVIHMAKLKETYLVVQSNHLGNILDKKSTVCQQRLFAIYVSKLNPSDVSTRRVTFSLADYEKIMNLQRFNITQIKETTRQMIGIPVFLDKPDGGFKAVPMFKEFDLYKKNNEWFIDIDCSDLILPYLFNLHKEFYKYELWNILRLSERNHQQMYRLLKQFEKTGERVITIDNLKLALGLEKDQYKQFKAFNQRVIQGCQKALQKNTDIKFEYDLIRSGRAVNAIKFNISTNKDYIDQLTLREFLNQEEAEDKIQKEIVNLEFENAAYEFLAEACNNEFNEKEIAILFDLLVKLNLPVSERGVELERFDYLQSKYHEMDLRNPSKSRFGYLKKIISADIEI